MDFQENVFIPVGEIHLSGAGSANARKVSGRCVLITLIKMCSWKSKMNNVVKYDDIVYKKCAYGVHAGYIMLIVKRKL